MNKQHNPKASISTTCPYCGVGCGVTATVENNRTEIDGDQSHPANFGKLCSKGYALADTLIEEDRLLKPSVDGCETTWSRAIERVAREFETVRDVYGPESIAFYVSGQLLTEDYYVANKFVKGYLGTANIDTNSRLCMASSVAAHKRAFGSDTVPGCYDDLEQANVVVLVGSNLSWCHPVLFQRVQKAKEANPSLHTVVLDPRKTATAELCDSHLQIKTGGKSDTALYLGLLRYLAKHNSLNHEWIELHTNGFDQALAKANDWTLARVAAYTGLSESEIREFYQLYQNNKKVVTVYSQGVNQSQNGTDTVNAIINIHLATGQIGSEGCGPFSITGQPNAMGGREVGGLANMLACHMDIENEQHQSLVQRYWHSPRIAKKPGLKAIDLFDAVAAGKIKALWIMATNPVDSMPDANVVAIALTACPFVVVSDVVANTDTADMANVLLPARAWSEKDGTVTNSERRISRQSSFRTAPENTRPDWWAIAKVAQEMGYTDAFNYGSASEIFAEYAGLTGFENNGSRSLDINKFKSITSTEYDLLKPFQWPQTGQLAESKKRFFADGKFYTQNGKANMIAVEVGDAVSTIGAKDNVHQTDLSDMHTNRTIPSPHQRKSAKQSFTLNTGRIRDQWHTMTRTGISARLSSHLGEPFVEINPTDASKLKIDEATIVDLWSANGTTRLRALITDRVAVAEVFVPIHWSNRFASNARVNAMVHPIHDPISGQPALKNQAVMLAASGMQSYGFMASREKPSCLEHEYWAIARTEQGWKTEFASTSSPLQVMNNLLHSAKLTLPDAELIYFNDAEESAYRACWFGENNQLDCVVFISSSPVQVARQATTSLFDHNFKTNLERIAAVSGTGLSTTEDTGTIICSCMQVGAKTIQRAIATGNATVQRIGVSCGAGTQCGTCRSDLLRMLASSTAAKSSEEVKHC